MIACLQWIFVSHYTPGLFTDEHLAIIFEHLYIISRVDDGSYFMPALLPHFSPKELENLLEDPAKPPLLFHFTDGCAPTGLFCALLVCLTSPTRGWKVHLKSKFLKGVRSNAACLQVPEMALLCIIVDSFHQFEVHYRCSAGSEKYLPKISEAVCEALEEVSHNRKYTIVFPRKSFFCRSEEHLGLAYLHVLFADWMPSIVAYLFKSLLACITCRIRIIIVFG